MLSLHTRIAHADTVHDLLVLPYDQRERCRQRARLASGEEVALFLVRGNVLRDGDLLTGEGGAAARVVRVVAAPEPTYLVRCIDATMLARCAFHLGNRHTRTEVGPGWLRIRVDPVLKEMVEGLGAQVDEELAKFEPETGAYGGGHGHHHDDHGPDGHRGGLLAPVPVRQRIHRPSDLVAPAAPVADSAAASAAAASSAASASASAAAADAGLESA